MGRNDARSVDPSTFGAVSARIRTVVPVEEPATAVDDEAVVSAEAQSAATPGSEANAPLANPVYDPSRLPFP